MTEPTGDCDTCGYHKAKANPAKGVKIPGEYGKCTRPEGLCKSKGQQVMTAGTGSTPVSKREKKRLAELEQVVFENFKAFYDVGSALREIRDKRLYRENYSTFADYSKDLWDMARPRAYQYIDAADVVDDLQNIPQIEWSKMSTIVDKTETDSVDTECLPLVDKAENISLQYLPLPKNECQARALAKLPPERRAEAWLQALETAPDGRVTASHIRKTINKMNVERVRTVVKEAKEITAREARIGADFRKAFDMFFEQVRIERDRQWRHTDKKVVLRFLKALYGAVDKE